MNPADMRPTAEPITATIAERVRTLRRQHVWSQEDLATELARKAGLISSAPGALRTCWLRGFDPTPR